MNLPNPPSGGGEINIWLRRLHAAIRGQRLRNGNGYFLKHTPDGTFLELRPGKGGISISLYRFKSMQNDYLVCRSWDGTTEGGVDVNIAKPPKLRFSIATETLRGSVINYTQYSIANQTRLATAGSTNETQYITPPYSVNDLVYAISATTLVKTVASGVPPVQTPIGLLDMNVDAREWAAF